MTYHSGEDIMPGDRITYADSPGSIDFVIIEATGDPAMDWHLEQHPRGGVMIVTERFGHVFLPDPEHEEDLDLVSRSP